MFPLSYIGDFTSAYQQQASSCTGSGICCSSNSAYSLARNQTVYTGFRVEKGQPKFPLVLDVTQGFVDSLIKFDAYGSNGSASGVSVTAAVTKDPAPQLQLPALALMHTATDSTEGDVLPDNIMMGNLSFNPWFHHALHLALYYLGGFCLPWTSKATSVERNCSAFVGLD